MEYHEFETDKYKFINHFTKNRKIHCLRKYDFINPETILTVNGYVIYCNGRHSNYVYCSKKCNYDVNVYNVNIYIYANNR